MKIRNNPKLLLVNSSIMVFIGTMCANVASYLYHLVMGRMLGPAGYGELASLISLLYIMSVPTSITQTVLIKYFSQYKATNAQAKAHDLFRKVTKYLVIIILVIIGLLMLGSPLILAFLHMKSALTLLWLGIFFGFTTLLIVNGSLLQGYQMFNWVAVYMALPVLVKLAFSIPLAPAGVSWVMFGTGISALISYIIFFFPVRFIFNFKSEPSGITKSKLISASIPTILTVLGITSLYSTDILLAKHYLSEVDSGIYSAVAVMGKIIFFASSAITIVVFPIISERTVKHENTRKITLTAVGGIALISLILTILYLTIPEFIINLLFGRQFAGAATHLGLFAVFMSLYSLGQNLSMVNLAQNKFYIGYAVITVALLQLIGIILFHDSVRSIIWVNVVVAAIFLAIAVLIQYKQNISHNYVRN